MGNMEKLKLKNNLDWFSKLFKRILLLVFNEKIKFTFVVVFGSVNWLC